MTDPPTFTAAPPADRPDDTRSLGGALADGPLPSPASADRYELGPEIARGGMGVVHAARDLGLRRDVAVKVLRDEFRHRPEVARRFVEEARIAGQLQHPGVPPVHDLGALPDGRPFIAMKLIKGRTLADLLRSERPELPRLLDVFERIAETVAFAHSKRVIHRDLKPANVMVGAFGEVQVMDWGLAKVLTSRGVEPPGVGPDAPPPESPPVSVVQTDRDPDSATRAGSVLGTPAYMPPEQAKGDLDHTDERSDVFALGAVLCELLTGKPPYTAGSADEVRALALTAQLGPARQRLAACGADPELVALADRCLSPDPADRPPDGKAVADAVAAYRAGVADRLRKAELERAEAAVRDAERRKRRRVQAALAAAGVLLLFGGGAVAWWQDRQAADRRQEREREEIRLRASTTAALDQAEAALKADRPDEADVVLAQVAGRLADGSPSDLADRLADLRRDLTLVRELDRVRDDHWNRGVEGYADVWTDYRRALAGHGILAPGLSPDQVAERVRASRVAGRVVAALDDALDSALMREGADRTLVVEALNRADPDPLAVAVRTAVRDGDNDRLRRLARDADGAAVRPAVATWLVLHHAIPPADAHRLLRAAAAARPADFLTLYTAGRRLDVDGEPYLDEAIGYYRAAIAARPGYGNTYYLLGTALNAKRDWAGAEAALRTAVALSPGWFGAYNQLALSLARQGRYGEGLGVLRAALERDPRLADSPTTYVRYYAACMAARCGTGQGIDPPPPAGRPALRGEALAWLRAELATWDRMHGPRLEEQRGIVHQTALTWLEDPDLAAVRHPLAVYSLPANERDEWRKLWADVRRLRDETARRELAPLPRRVDK